MSAERRRPTEPTETVHVVLDDAAVHRLGDWAATLGWELEQLIVVVLDIAARHPERVLALASWPDGPRASAGPTGPAEASSSRLR